MRYAVWVLAIAAAGVGAVPVTLVHGGQGLPIVQPADAAKEIAPAIGDLQQYIEARGGAKPALVSDADFAGGAALFVGECRQAQEADLPPADAGPEAYAVRARDGSVFLTGRNWWSVIFAVDSFLEDSLGVRWFMPGPLGEYVPPRAEGDLVVEVTDRAKAPDFSPRIWSGNQMAPHWGNWNRRNKISLTSNLPYRQFQNNLFRVFPPEKYAKTHPEYYPLIDGKRWIPPAGAGPYWRPCESNPDVVRLTVEYARNWFDTHPDVYDFSVGMDDISHLCQCENCRALDPSPEAWRERKFSDRHYWFVNQIAREIAKTHPDKRIGTLIYSIARELPTKIEKLEPNVFGYITQCEAEWWREGLREKDEALTREWRRRCTHLCRYTYWGLGWVTPRYYPHYMAEAMKFDHSLDFNGMYIEVYTCWPNTAPMIWAGSKLQWDTSLDVDQLLDEFMTKMYGKAAPQMARYFEALENTWTGGNPGRTGWGHRNVPTQAASMTVEQLKGLEGLLAEALQAADSDVVRQRIEIAQTGLKFGGYLVQERTLSDRLMALPVGSAEEAKAAIEGAGELDRLVAERKAYYAQVVERKDLAGENLKWLTTQYGRGAGPQFQQVEGGAGTGLVKGLAYLAQQAPEQVDQVIGELRQREGGGEAPPMLRAWRYVAEQRPANMLPNAGFEDLTPNTAKAEQDWKTEGAPRGWSTWHRAPRETRFAVVGEEAREGQHCAVIAESDSACYLSNIAVEPGQTYLCRLWAKREPATAPGSVSLSIRYREQSGGWLQDRSAETSVDLPPGVAGWQPLFVLVRVPPNARQLVFMCSTSGQKAGDKVLFDDGGVFAIPKEP